MSKKQETEEQTGTGFYKRNENLPGKSSTFTWNEEMKTELKLCVKSILNFAEQHFFIIAEEGKQKIELFKFQKNILKMLKANRFSVILSARQMGKSTVVAIYALWVACFQEDKNIIIIANKEATAAEQFERIRMAYEQLPNYLKPGIESWRKDGFKLLNGSKITISSTSSSAARGGTVNVLIIDEFAYIEPNVLKDLWRSAIPTISSFKKSQIVVISTQNGTQNKFYDLYSAAEKGENGWAHIRVDWNERPDRDEKWKTDQIKLLGSTEIFNQEFGTSFVDEGESILDEALLASMRAAVKSPGLELDEGEYKIWKRPEPHNLYTIGVDVGEGVGRNYSVVQILDITDLKAIEQVAVYSNNTLDPYHFATKLIEIAEQWGNPPLCVERNNSGGQVIDVLNEKHHYELLVSYTHGSNAKYNTTERKGILSNTNTKYEGVSNMRYWVNKLCAVKINDIVTVQEFETFVRQPNNTWSGKSSKNNDDRVMSLIWAISILIPKITERYFDVTDFDEQGRPMHISGIYDRSFAISQSVLNTSHIINDIHNIKAPVEDYTLHYMSPQMINGDPWDTDRHSLLNWLHNL